MPLYPPIFHTSTDPSTSFPISLFSWATHLFWHITSLNHCVFPSKKKKPLHPHTQYLPSFPLYNLCPSYWCSKYTSEVDTQRWQSSWVINSPTNQQVIHSHFLPFNLFCQCLANHLPSIAEWLMWKKFSKSWLKTKIITAALAFTCQYEKGHKEHKADWIWLY